MIPSQAHLIWVGERLPWIHALAPISAVRSGGFERVVFHHDRNLSRTDLDSLRGAAAGIDLREIDPARDAGFRRLGSTAFSNRYRVRLLVEEGGVYLDMDTLTISGFRDLLGSDLFCGEESVVFPEDLRESLNSFLWGMAVAKTSARRVCRWSPRGVRMFEAISKAYVRRVSNAVIGARAGHPFLQGLLDEMERMVELPGTRPKDLGVRLLQRRVRRLAPGHGERPLILPQDLFYPLPPDVSAHWFRAGSAGDCLDRLTGRTRCVHWYASLLRGREHLDFGSGWMESNRDRVGMAALIHRNLSSRSTS